MGKKSKKDRKRDKRAQEAAAEREALEQRALVRRRALRIAAIAIPLVTAVVAVSIYLATDSARVAALVGLIGVTAWFPVLLGVIGGSVRPRDRTRAGSIDFGQRR